MKILLSIDEICCKIIIIDSINYSIYRRIKNLNISDIFYTYIF